MNGHRSVHGEIKTARDTSWKVSRTNQLKITKMGNTKSHHIRVNGSVYKHCNCCTRISIYGCGCIWLVANRTNSWVKVVHSNNFRWMSPGGSVHRLRTLYKAMLQRSLWCARVLWESCMGTLTGMIECSWCCIWFIITCVFLIIVGFGFVEEQSVRTIIFHHIHIYTHTNAHT